MKAIAKATLHDESVQYLCQNDLCAMKDFFMQEIQEGDIDAKEFPNVEYFDTQHKISEVVHG
ncbi:hypothetical protein KS4_23360 [Poriferisphaera corsica]|uniref:Uncharacterized protein n=2 Tax=Poriferisphaera corsica TaxID=2528020 RepID=A0A517YVN5_9BACT|nr:hypothetical protein KS4_23360 [Poriferisphaera corsica]